MTREHWKDWLEGIGIVAIAASLVFVALQMRQAQGIAISEGYLSILSSRIDIANSIKDHVEIWIKGTSGEELTGDEAAIFAILVNHVNEANFNDYMQIIEIAGYEAAQYVIHDFAGFLYNNPGARRVWLAREDNLIKMRTLIDPEGHHFSFWKDNILNDLAILDGKATPIEKGSFVDW